MFSLESTCNNQPQQITFTSTTTKGDRDGTGPPSRKGISFAKQSGTNIKFHSLPPVVTGTGALFNHCYIVANNWDTQKASGKRSTSQSSLTNKKRKIVVNSSQKKGWPLHNSLPYESFDSSPSPSPSPSTSPSSFTFTLTPTNKNNGPPIEKGGRIISPGAAYPTSNSSSVSVPSSSSLLTSTTASSATTANQAVVSEKKKAGADTSVVGVPGASGRGSSRISSYVLRIEPHGQQFGEGTPSEDLESMRESARTQMKELREPREVLKRESIAQSKLSQVLAEVTTQSGRTTNPSHGRDDDETGNGMNINIPSNNVKQQKKNHFIT